MCVANLAIRSCFWWRSSHDFGYLNLPQFEKQTAFLTAFFELKISTNTPKRTANTTATLTQVPSTTPSFLVEDAQKRTTSVTRKKATDPRTGIANPLVLGPTPQITLSAAAGKQALLITTRSLVIKLLKNREC